MVAYACAAGAGNALTAIVAAGIAQGITPLTVPPDLEDAVDRQREVVKQVSIFASCSSLPWILICTPSLRSIGKAFADQHSSPGSLYVYENMEQCKTLSG